MNGLFLNFKKTNMPLPLYKKMGISQKKNADKTKK